LCGGIFVFNNVVVLCIQITILLENPTRLWYSAFV